jgi:hypothetical protein
MNRLSRRARWRAPRRRRHARADEPPLRIVLGFPPGASSDTLTRLVADKMRARSAARSWSRTRPARSASSPICGQGGAPDGNTLLMTPLANMVAFPHSYAKLDYDPFKDFVPVAELAPSISPSHRLGGAGPRRWPNTRRSPGAAAPTPTSPRPRPAACRISSA